MWQWLRQWSHPCIVSVSPPTCGPFAFPGLPGFLRSSLFVRLLSASAWCWSLMTKTMAEMCWLAKANFSPSLLLSLLHAPFCFFFSCCLFFFPCILLVFRLCFLPSFVSSVFWVVLPRNWVKWLSVVTWFSNCSFRLILSPWNVSTRIGKEEEEERS